MTDNFKLKGIASTIRARRANRAIYPASDITQRRPKIVRTAPITMRNGHRTDSGRTRPSVQRTSTLLPITATLFRQVTPAVKAEDTAASITTKPDTANTYIDADAANVTGHKMDNNPSVTFSPSGTSLSQDNTRNHVSQVNVSSEPAGHVITRRRRRVNRTVRRIPENSAYLECIHFGRTRLNFN
ncbi:hypothetical protein QR685DRAFT_447171 [Neurospora intermedia]|uniref:Uncharacterized protein n=1 Tax=Neurospora intermedia TaxID=5142 RepID=A0ABR3D9W6_NEUIN